MPKEENGATKGYAFIEYLDEDMAMAAMQQTQGYRLDKNHVFKVNRFDDFERLAKVRASSGTTLCSQSALDGGVGVSDMVQSEPHGVWFTPLTWFAGVARVHQASAEGVQT
jgi:hypothetical protein